ncbi:MAG: hypothetical protein ACLQLG_13580 [Thermoguttaceae bacterium]
MPYNFQRIKAGQIFRPNEPTANAILSAAEKEARHGRDPGRFNPFDYVYRGNPIQVQNQDGAALGRFSVVGLGNALITDAENLSEFQNYPRLTVSAPSFPGDAGAVAVLLEPLAAGAIGLAALAGVVPCQVQVTSGLDWYWFADVLSGDPTQLLLQPWGRAQVLWKAPPSGGWGSNGGTNTVWALVQLGLPSGLTQVRATLTSQLNQGGSAGFTIDGTAGFGTPWSDTAYDAYLGPDDSLASGAEFRAWWDILARQWVAVNTGCPS